MCIRDSSKAIAHSDTQPSVLATVWYVFLLAAQDPTYQGPALDNAHRQKPSKRRKTATDNSPPSNFSGVDLHDVKPTRSLSTSRGRTVLRGSAGERQVVAKWAAVDDESLQWETEMYMRLQALQSSIIPTLLGWGTTVSRRYLILQYYPCVTLTEARKTRSVWKLVKSSVDVLHANNVIHGDLECRNVLLCNNRAMLIDLEDAYISTDSRAQRDELKRLHTACWRTY